MNFAFDVFGFPISISDLVQIFILYLTFYWVLKAARGSRFGQALTGVGVLFGVLILFTYIFQFDVLTHIVQGLLFYIAISSVVIFQPEIRRMLAQLGSLLFQDHQRNFSHQSQISPEGLAECILILAKRKMGALLAIERGISLGGYEESGIALDARISPELLISIFTEPLPMHDGGAIIRKGRLASTHCLFPVSTNAELSVSGMRHRAAVGLSEETDALVLVVSEETGRIAIAHNGKLIRYPLLNEDTRLALIRSLRRAMPTEKTPMDRFADAIAKRMEKFRKGKTNASAT